MRLITTEIIAKYTRTEHPDLYLKYADAAEMYVQVLAGKEFHEIELEYGFIPGVFTQAALMIAGTLIEFCEPNPYTGICPPMSCFKFPYSVKMLIKEFSKPGIDERIANIESILSQKNKKGQK